MRIRIGPAIILTTIIATSFGILIQGRADAKNEAARAVAATDPSPDDDDTDGTPVGSGNSCSVLSSCKGGCSVTCTANKSAHCNCIQREVMCHGPYGGTAPCYDYTPSCTCQ